ncbi:hypothetical protein E4A47_01250 [Micrococcus flavus]|uniref:Uncharacterized protein n=1 Tax=Micrococcus flavus TaxID=384602 RepID=A0A4Y8X3Q7_9MICC|nr:hypothetical protein [Micrococcus flavus]MBB4882870.1 hypothetical protein [Micrococcus flavus]TFI04308.1 hypothetical protein E4A47_01250 [Micrococcus flavus]GGK40677.1 hypothetical protein GCM10007073_04470 [Micrococcus flavus]
MTITTDAHPASPLRPARHGLPWDMADFEALAEAVVDSTVAVHVAERIGRGVSSIHQRARMLLPPHERHLAGQLALSRLGDLLDSGEHDWRKALLQPDPVRPVEVVEHHHHGWEGLAATHRAHVAYAVVDAADRMPADVLDELREALETTSLGFEVAQLRSSRAHEEGLDEDGAWRNAVSWLSRALFDGDRERAGRMAAPPHSRAWHGGAAHHGWSDDHPW